MWDYCKFYSDPKYLGGQGSSIGIGSCYGYYPPSHTDYRALVINVKKTELDFSELHERMQWYVDGKSIPFVATAVLQGDEVVDLHYCGQQDIEGGKPLSETSIFRMHSSTKIACSIAAMMLYEENKFSLDDPIDAYIPAFRNMRVLKSSATSIDDTEPTHSPILIRHILSHTAGLSYGFIEPDSIINQAYNKRSINPMAPGSDMSLESMCDQLGDLPLAYQPGTSWRYSFATDVTARLIEVLSGKRFDEFLKERILGPLGMSDTDFFVPADKLHRFTTLYLPEDPLDQMSQCAAPMDSPTNTSNGHLPTFLSGGGGLMSTLADYLTFTQMIINEGSHQGMSLIKPETLQIMRTNQCPEGVGVRFPMWSMPGTSFGLGFALKHEPAKGEPPSAIGEYHWGGMAGTHFWWSPKANVTGICMTQRMPGFWHPFSQDFKRLAYKIAA
jgi:CubicO group peptidase (beta-lactamase class C family)